MVRSGRIFLNAICLLALYLLPACAMVGSSPTPSTTPVSIADIQKNYRSFEGQLISVRGYGFVMMTAPLCPGHVGMDTRLSFLSEADSSIYARLIAFAKDAERSDTLRDFQVYVRVFNGEIGCPGNMQTLIFPYLEIVGVGQ
jgi:hypothetical protein